MSEKDLNPTEAELNRGELAAYLETTVSDWIGLTSLREGETWIRPLLDATELREDKHNGEGSLRIVANRHWDGGESFCITILLEIYDGDEWVQYGPDRKDPTDDTFNAIWAVSSYTQAMNAAGCYRHLADVHCENVRTEESNRIFRLKKAAEAGA